MDEPTKTSPQLERDEKGRLLPGQTSLNPAGRPRGQTMKEYAREYFMLKTPEEKVKYIEMVEQKRPGFAWEMGEGKATQQEIVEGTHRHYVITDDDSPHDLQTPQQPTNDNPEPSSV